MELHLCQQWDEKHFGHTPFLLSLLIIGQNRQFISGVCVWLCCPLTRSRAPMFATTPLTTRLAPLPYQLSQVHFIAPRVIRGKFGAIV